MMLNRHGQLLRLGTTTQYGAMRFFFSSGNSDNSAPPPASTQSESEQALAKENEALKEKLKQAEDSLLYALAEQENIRKRGRKDVENAKAFGIEKFAKGLFDVADVLKQATSRVADIRNEKQPVDPKEVWGLISGVRMTEINLMKTLKEFGVTNYGQPGEVFNPNLHESLVLVHKSHHLPGSIHQVLVQGWMLNGRVSRAAQVAVVSGEAVRLPPPEVLLERKVSDEEDEADQAEKEK